MEITPELQAVIDHALEPVVAKNRELLGELKIAKAKAKGTDIDPVEHANLQTRNEELQVSLDKASKSSKSESEKLSKSLDTEKSFTRRLIVENGLTEAASKHVAPEYIPAVRAMLLSQVQVIEEGEARTAKIGDKNLADFVESWVQTAEGKHFAKAPVNGGGGARGSASSGGSNVLTRVAFEQMPPGERMAFIKAGGNIKD